MADQRHLNAKASIADITAKVEEGSAALKEVSQVGNQTALQGEEGASHQVHGIPSDNRQRFLTILDNVLTVGELARVEEQAGQPHPHSGDPGGAGEG